MIRHPQRTADDCTICSIATYLGLTYEAVMEVAVKTGYVTGSGMGSSPSLVLEELGYEPKLKVRSILRIPCLVSVNSINFPDKGHLVVYTGFEVIDCSNLKQVTEEMLPDIIRYSYWVD